MRAVAFGCSCASTTRLAVPPSVAHWGATKTQSPVKSCESPIVQLSRLLRRFHDCSMTFVRYNLLQMIVLSHICLRAERQYQAGGYGGPPAQDRQSLRIHWPGAQRTAPGVDVTKDLKGTYGANKRMDDHLTEDTIDKNEQVFFSALCWVPYIG